MLNNLNRPLLDACICISTLPVFISTNVIAIAASALVGRAKVTEILTDMASSSFRCIQLVLILPADQNLRQTRNLLLPTTFGSHLQTREPMWLHL